MKLIIGLGNPGRKYVNTRHNAGFRVLDQLAKSLGIPFSDEPKFKGQLLEFRHVHAGRVLLLKPQTFMNLSGESVVAVSQFYKIEAADFLAVYDDLDLPLGRLRLVAKGSAGGHNGLKSLIEKLGLQDFPRLKLGIGRPKIPQQPVVDYVLQDFSKEEIPLITEATGRAVLAVKAFLETNDLAKVMNLFNKSL